MLLQLREGLVNCCFHGIGITKEVVVQGRFLEVSPKPFYGIQVRAVLGQPHDKRMTFVFRQKVQNLTGCVISRVVQHQNKESAAVAREQLPQELGERRCVLFRMNHVMGLPAGVVEGTVNTPLLVGSGGWNRRAHCPEGPDFRQRRVEMNFTLIEEEQVEVRFGPCRVFFRKSKTAFFSL